MDRQHRNLRNSWHQRTRNHRISWILCPYIPIGCLREQPTPVVSLLTRRSFIWYNRRWSTADNRRASQVSRSPSGHKRESNRWGKSLSIRLDELKHSGFIWELLDSLLWTLHQNPARRIFTTCDKRSSPWLPDQWDRWTILQCNLWNSWRHSGVPGHQHRTNECKPRHLRGGSKVEPKHLVGDKPAAQTQTQHEQEAVFFACKSLGHAEIFLGSSD